MVDQTKSNHLLTLSRMTSKAINSPRARMDDSAPHRMEALAQLHSHVCKQHLALRKRPWDSGGYRALLKLSSAVDVT